MRKCPRCRSSMILDSNDVIEGGQRVWRCLGCGRELLSDPQRQAEDEAIQARIRREGQRRPSLV